MDILRGFDGILQVDGYTGYDALAGPKRVNGKPVTLAYVTNEVVPKPMLPFPEIVTGIKLYQGLTVIVRRSGH
jgi:hypothetical protein